MALHTDDLVFYSIGDFAKKVGITTKTLRNWEKKGWLMPHHRSPSGYRYYSDKQLQQVLSGDLQRL